MTHQGNACDRLTVGKGDLNNADTLWLLRFVEARGAKEEVLFEHVRGVCACRPHCHAGARGRT